MIKKTLLVALSVSSFVNAQFKIDGELKGYSSKPVLIKVYENGTTELAERITTDNDGKFVYNHPSPYTGKVIFELDQGGFDILVANEPVQFSMDIHDPTHSISFNGGVNQQVKEAFALEDKKALRDFTLSELLNIYEPQDEFYKAINKEINRIDSLMPEPIINQSIQYYVDAKGEIASYKSQALEKSEILQSSMQHLVKDNEDLERFGLLPEFLSTYISYAVAEAKDMEEANSKIESAVDELLNKAETETSRGQAILTTIIPMLEGNGFDDLAEKYLSQATQLTCEITPELKQLIEGKDNIRIGSVAPNIIFNQTIKGAKSLYDVEADKKLVIFWASWCPHCMNELPNIKAFYNEFVTQGGEIVAFSLDLMEEDYKNAIEGTQWINFSDLKKWESPYVATYGVISTPTMILLDKDNKILKRGSRISEFK